VLSSAGLLKSLELVRHAAATTLSIDTLSGSMWLRPVITNRRIHTRALCLPQRSPRRRLMTLAIETSCDDTSCAIVEKSTKKGRPHAQLHFHKKITSNNAEFQGVHPLVSLRSHQENLAKLVSEAISHLPPTTDNRSHCPEDRIAQGERHGDSRGPQMKRLPDFISVTRGPGMRSNLFTGLDTAKGLAVAWQVLNGCRLLKPS
jgi:N6-L-threonylcarbamoyladenine synthase